MFTIQSFLHKLRKSQMSNEYLKNLKYCFIILCYTIISIMIIRYLKVDLNGDKETVEVLASVSSTSYHNGQADETSGNNNRFDTEKNGQSGTQAVARYVNHEMVSDSIIQIITANHAPRPVESYVNHMNLVYADIYFNEFLDEKSELAKEKVIKANAKKEATKKSKQNDVAETMNSDVAKLKLSANDIGVLERIVEAEATGEDVKGKMLVANVILNRVNDKSFPNSVEDVVFQKVGGSYQFSPISDKRYWSVKVSKDTKEAVSRVIKGEDYSQGALYFSARRLASRKNMQWFDSKLKWLFQYGNHEFFTHK